MEKNEEHLQARQGDGERADLPHENLTPGRPVFNVILDTLADIFQERAKRLRWGYELSDGTLVNIILFADNYWLVATDHGMLENMTKAWLSLLSEYGWETPVE